MKPSSIKPSIIRQFEKNVDALLPRGGVLPKRKPANLLVGIGRYGSVTHGALSGGRAYAFQLPPLRRGVKRLVEAAQDATVYINVESGPSAALTVVISAPDPDCRILGGARPEDNWFSVDNVKRHKPIQQILKRLKKLGLDLTPYTQRELVLERLAAETKTYDRAARALVTAADTALTRTFGANKTITFAAVTAKKLAPKLRKKLFGADGNARYTAHTFNDPGCLLEGVVPDKSMNLQYLDTGRAQGVSPERIAEVIKLLIEHGEASDH